MSTMDNTLGGGGGGSAHAKASVKSTTSRKGGTRRLGEQVFVRSGNSGYHPAKIVLLEPPLTTTISSSSSNDEMVLIEWDTTGYRQYVPIGNIDWVARTNALGTTRNRNGIRTSKRVMIDNYNNNNEQNNKQPLVAVTESTTSPNKKQQRALDLNIDTASSSGKKRNKPNDMPTTTLLTNNATNESKTPKNEKEPADIQRLSPRGSQKKIKTNDPSTTSSSVTKESKTPKNKIKRASASNILTDSQKKSQYPNKKQQRASNLNIDTTSSSGTKRNKSNHVPTTSSSTNITKESKTPKTENEPAGRLSVSNIDTNSQKKIKTNDKVQSFSVKKEESKTPSTKKQPAATSSTSSRKRVSAASNIDNDSQKKSKKLNDPSGTSKIVQRKSKMSNTSTTKQQLVLNTSTNIASQNGRIISEQNHNDQEEFQQQYSHSTLNPIRSTSYDKPNHQITIDNATTKNKQQQQEQRTHSSMTPGQSTDSVADNNSNRPPVDRTTTTNQRIIRRHSLHTATEHEVASIISNIAGVSNTRMTTQISTAVAASQIYDHIANITAVVPPITATTTRQENKTKARRRSVSRTSGNNNQLIQKPDKSKSAPASVNDHYLSPSTRNGIHTAMDLSNKSTGQQPTTINPITRNSTRKRTKRLGKREINENIKNFFENSRQIAISAGVQYEGIEIDNNDSDALQEDNGIFTTTTTATTSSTTTVRDTTRNNNDPQTTFVSLDSNSSNTGTICVDSHSCLLPPQVPENILQLDNKPSYYYTQQQYSKSSNTGAFVGVNSHLTLLPSQVPKDPLPTNMSHYYYTHHSQGNITHQRSVTSSSTSTTDCISAFPVVQSTLLDIAPQYKPVAYQQQQAYSLEENTNLSGTIDMDGGHQWNRDNTTDTIKTTTTLNEPYNKSRIHVDDDGPIAEVVPSSNFEIDDNNERLFWWGVGLLLLLVSILGKLIDIYYFSRQ